MRARTDSGEADTQATAAEAAADAAWTARGMAWTAVAAADAAAMSAMGATTSPDAQMYQKAAEAAEDTAEAQATDAGMYYMAAMDAAAAAEMAAGTHVLGLFMSANAYDVDDDDAADRGGKCRGGYRCSGKRRQMARAAKPAQPPLEAAVMWDCRHGSSNRR